MLSLLFVVFGQFFTIGLLGFFNWLRFFCPEVLQCRPDAQCQCPSVSTTILTMDLVSDTIQSSQVLKHPQYLHQCSRWVDCPNFSLSAYLDLDLCILFIRHFFIFRHHKLDNNFLGNYEGEDIQPKTLPQRRCIVQSH